MQNVGVYNRLLSCLAEAEDSPDSPADHYNPGLQTLAIAGKIFKALLPKKLQINTCVVQLLNDLYIQSVLFK